MWLGCTRVPPRLAASHLRLPGMRAAAAQLPDWPESHHLVVGHCDPSITVKVRESQHDPATTALKFVVAWQHVTCPAGGGDNGGGDGVGGFGEPGGEGLGGGDLGDRGEAGGAGESGDSGVGGGAGGAILPIVSTPNRHKPSGLQ